MAARALDSATISFGLVSIPVKLFTSASSDQLRFNMLHKKCGGRLRQQMFCPTDEVVVNREDTVRGYEYARGQYVTFSDEELKALEAERTGAIEIVEFVPLDTIDFVQVEKSYYLGPDKSGDKAYKLLSESMRSTKKVAVGQWAARGKEQLVLIRPYGEGGLILHQLYHANEVREFSEVDTGATFKFSDVERDLAKKLIEQLATKSFEAGKFSDTYRERVQSAVDQKVSGQEITVAPEQPKAQIIDLFEALKKSLSDAKAKAANDEKTPLKPPKKAESDRPPAKKAARSRK